MPKTNTNNTVATVAAAEQFAAQIGGQVVQNADGTVTVTIAAPPAAAVKVDDTTVVAPVVEGAGLTEKDLCFVGRVKNLNRRRSSGNWSSEQGKGTIISSGRNHKIASVDLTKARGRANKAFIANGPEYVEGLLAIIDKLTGTDAG